MGFFLGYKTYITVGLAAAAYAAHLAGLITREQLELILMGLGIPAVGFLRSAITTQSAAVSEQVEEVKQDVKEAKAEARGLLSPPPVHRTR